MPEVLVLPRQCEEQMINHARRDLPREAVGLVGGNAEGRAVAVLPLVNRIDIYGFFADPYSQYLAMKLIKKAALTPIAAYHSHPFGAPELSAADLHFGGRNGLIQIVIALGAASDAPVVRAFKVVAGHPVRLPIRSS